MKTRLSNSAYTVQKFKVRIHIIHTLLVVNNVLYLLEQCLHCTEIYSTYPHYSHFVGCEYMYIEHWHTNC